MTDITIYDTDADVIEKVSEKNDMTVAGVVELLLDYIEDMKTDNNLK